MMKQGWEIKDFEDCIEKVVYTEKVQRKDFLEDGKFPVISQEQNFINGYWNDSDVVFKITKPVVIFGDHTQVLKYVDFDFVLGADGVKILEPIDGLNPRFFYYFLKSVNLKSLGYARHYRLLKEIRIPLPPLPEQQRLVTILDEVFAALATAKENAAKNRQNARELFESVLHGVFANRGVGWEERKLGEITTKIGSGATPLGGEKSYKTEGISLIRSLNVHDMRFRYKDLAFIDKNQADKLSNVVVEVGDVLLNITGASVARCSVVPENVLPARVNQHVSIIRLMEDEMVPEFLHYGLISKEYKDQLLKTGEKGGSTRQAITKAEIENFSVRYPPLPEQRAIVAKLDALSAETKKLEAIYQQKLANLEELKQSVLRKAFRGEI